MSCGGGRRSTAWRRHASAGDRGLPWWWRAFTELHYGGHVLLRDHLHVVVHHHIEERRVHDACDGEDVTGQTTPQESTWNGDKCGQECESKSAVKAVADQQRPRKVTDG